MEGKEICGKSDAGYRSPPQIVSNSDRRLLDVSLGGREGREEKSVFYGPREGKREKNCCC